MTRYPTPSALCLAGVAALLLPASVRAEETPAPPPATAGPNDTVAALSDLEARSPKDFNNPGLIAEINAEVIRLVETNRLASGEEFFRASGLLGKHMNDFRVGRVQYELLLAAVAKDHPAAESSLAVSWDTLLGLIGRPLRIDAHSLAARNPQFYHLDPAPACIQAVMRDPADARAKLAGLEDNPEIKTIVDADQAVRQTNWSTLTEEDRKAIMEGDHQRNARIREIVAAGDVHTANDFARAALVMQHSGRFDGFQLAHELAACSLLLGDRRSGRWLVAASYDRMLRSVALDQRFGTQYGPAGPLRIDEAGISDAQRQALGCPTLAAARLRSSRHSSTLVDKDNTITDPRTKVSVSYPPGWKLSRSSQVDAAATSIIFTHPDHLQTPLTLYYRMQPLATDPAGPEAALRQQATVKETDRRDLAADYANDPASFVYRETGGRPSLSWTARFTHEGAPWVEHLVRVSGPASYALIFVKVPSEKLEALRPLMETMADSLQLP
jgi:hypothetical protein